MGKDPTTNNFPIFCQHQGISSHRGGGDYRLKHLDSPHLTALGVQSKIQDAIHCSH